MDLSSLSLDLGTTALVQSVLLSQSRRVTPHGMVLRLNLTFGALTWKSATRKVREKLQEVMHEGDADQRREAQTLSALLADRLSAGRAARRCALRRAHLNFCPAHLAQFLLLKNPPVVAGFAAHRFWDGWLNGPATCALR
jgi:hypothetical protein